MSPEEAQQNAPRRRGRPPGSKIKRTRSKREGGGELVDRLNAMVAELITKNRQLQRQVNALNAQFRAGRMSQAQYQERVQVVQTRAVVINQRTAKAIGL